MSQRPTTRAGRAARAGLAPGQQPGKTQNIRNDFRRTVAYHACADGGDGHWDCCPQQDGPAAACDTMHNLFHDPKRDAYQAAVKATASTLAPDGPALVTSERAIAAIEKYGQPTWVLPRLRAAAPDAVWIAHESGVIQKYHPLLARKYGMDRVNPRCP